MVFLEELVESGGFSAKVQSLALDFRRKFSLPGIHQLGLVVADVMAAAEKLERLGIGPFFLARGSPVLWRERGEELRFEGALGLAFFQGFELELLEPGQGSDFYRQSLDPGGKIVVQHLGFLVPDVDAWSKRLSEQGFPVWVRGRLKSGPLSTDFAYMDTVAETGLVIEFISWRFLGIRFSPFKSLIHTLGRMEKWSGVRIFKT